MSGTDVMKDPQESDAGQVFTSSATRIWGLDVRNLHSAWWASRGVACIRRGDNVEIPRSAELFLLLEQTQLVVFDLQSIISQITWNPVVPISLRVVDRSSDAYREQVVLDSMGDVVGIRRAYTPDEKVSYRLVITAQREVAEEWAKAKSRRSGWIAIRNKASARFSGRRVVGHTYDSNLADDEKKLLLHLTANWNDPSRVISGIREVEPGVFAPESLEISSDTKFIGPVWLGFGARQNLLEVGPACIVDREDSPESTIRSRRIDEIMPATESRSLRLFPRKSLYGVTKRAFDFFVAAICLIIFLPILALVALAVVIDDGFPVFFGHVRQQRGGDEFKCWKFRTMRRNAESMVEELRAMNKADGPQVFIENDPRVTRVGRFLRASQLDELPQLFNVLKGEMSIVGPRPSPDRENQICPAWRELRLSVRPGITGLWQVSRTRESGLDFQEWVRFDLDYVRSASLRLDFRIILDTVIMIVRRK